MRHVGRAVLLAIVATPALAAERPDRGNGMFFNRAGATVAAMRDDLTACRATAEGAESQINGLSVLAGGVGALIGGALAGGRLKRVNVENCMLVRGWTLWAMTRAEGARWQALGEAGRDARLAVLAGAAAPDIGAPLRTWHNDYAEPALWVKE